MQLGLSEPLSNLVARCFTAAKDGGHLVFSPTHLSNIQASGTPFQLRYCPALAKKPSAIPKPTDEGQGHGQPKPQKPDPFDNPQPELLLADIPAGNPGYRLVLNKFPIIPNHFILATKEWKSQTDLLEKEDLEATYACIREWDDAQKDRNKNGNGDGKRLFAFFNSGPESGASQPHRHIQFLPVEAMRDQDGEGQNTSSWKPLIDTVAEQQPTKPAGSATEAAEYRSLGRLPFVHFALPLPPNPPADTLHAIYLSLYRAAVTAAAKAENPDSNQADNIPPQTSGEAAISHNLAMTDSAMMICPRRNETASVPIDKNAAGGNGEVLGAGEIALNGTILAGTLVVKAEAEWNELRRDPEILTGALQTVGYPGSVAKGSSL